MRRILLLGLAVILFFGWANALVAEDTQGLKLGFINLKKILDSYKKVADGESALRKEAEAKDKERNKMVKEIKNLRERIDLLKEDKKEKKRQELDKKIKELQDFSYQMKTGLRQKRDEKFREIMNEVKAVIEEYGRSRNYNIIIDDTLLLYKEKELDVTDDVVRMLNQRYKK